MTHLAHPLSLTVLALAGGCATGIDALAPPLPRQQVRIDNPSRAVLHGSCADTGAVRVPFGDAAELDLELPLGRWQVAAELDGRQWQVPLPLAKAAARPPLVRLRIAPPPAARPGLVWIPPGPALVGDVLGVGQEDERPARVLDVAGFWLARTETTNAGFAAFLNGVGEVDDDWLDLGSRKCRIARDADGRFRSDAEDLPVVTVSHAGALAYCAWRTATTGERHRLPTEIEWEKAARGPGSCTYDHGDVYHRAAANQESGRLQAVGSHGARGFGLCDMTGNAFEWVADSYRADAYRQPDAASVGPFRVLRGGSFVLDGMFLRNSMRMKLRPDVRADDVGFRVVIEPVETN